MTTTNLRVPSDVIIHIFARLKPGTRFLMNKARIIAIFREISEEREFKELFKDFRFNTSNMPIWCDTINNTIDRLTMSSLLSRIGLEFEITRNLTKLNPSLFNKKEIELLKSIALQFARKIGAYKPY